jgi:hypothetical protein
MLQRRLTGSTRRRRQVALGAALLGVQVAATGCSTPTDKCPALPPAADLEVYRSAERAQVEHLENEVARLREDLDQAEEAMVTVESGLRDVHIRADAVSSLAEARIAVERASKNVSWRPAAVREAQSKLEEAELQLQAGHPGSAVFFASRARRIAENLDAEARRVARASSTRFIRGRRVNLRAGPSTEHQVMDVLTRSTPVFREREEGDWVLVRTVSGPAGWVHGSLLTSR